MNETLNNLANLYIVQRVNDWEVILASQSPLTTHGERQRLVDFEKSRLQSDLTAYLEQKQIEIVGGLDPRYEKETDSNKRRRMN